ncbi:MAG: hypothetical protein IPG17_20280 [Sandaracinaceae bacterium]|jgi:hypothetical protein|nr:hypothetical protein [Sandaracinaceae bacterium]MBK7777297.1 hypothetical protein [Sandaracinaceae bacterium]MBK8408796.1 hypothetical protein [Sandaracinaceae bacterium]
MADQHHDEPDVPGLPQIQDEAADTPMWLPATGLGLLVIMVLMLVYHVAQGPETAAAEGDVAAEGAEAEGGEGAEAEAEPEGAAEAPAGEAAPAEDDHAGHGH